MTHGAKFMNGESRRLLIEMLFAEKCSCIIRNGDRIGIFRDRGVMDLYRLLGNDRSFLDGAFVADKVVGKGAAALMVLGGVSELFADVISQSALKLLESNGVKVDYTLAVPHIINRTKTDWCPIEKLCRECTTAEECLPLIRGFIEKLPQ